MAKLQDGIRRKKLIATKVTQKGVPKVVGTSTILDRVQPSRRQRRQLQGLIRKHCDHSATNGLRSLATDMSQVLKLGHTMGHETARRQCRELRFKTE